MSTRNTAIFDLDGTLLNTIQDLTNSVNYCMKKYGGPVYTCEEIREKVGNGIYVLMEKALPDGRSNPNYDACMKDFPVHYKEHMLDNTKPYDGIIDMLHTLKEHGYKLAIVSNKFDAAVKGLCKDFFADEIEVAIGESPAIHKKPAPDTVFQAMRELNVKPENCIYIGDSEVDIQTAANAGIPCISVNWGFKSTEFLKENEYEVFCAEDGEKALEILKSKEIKLKHIFS